MSTFTILALLLLVCATLFLGEGFTSPARERTRSNDALEAGRRDFLDAAMATTAGLVISSVPSIAGAEEEGGESKVVDDLAMPSEEEQKKAEVSSGI